MELASQRNVLRAQRENLLMNQSSAQTTLDYLQKQKEDTTVYYAVGRMYEQRELRFFVQGLYLVFSRPNLTF